MPDGVTLRQLSERSVAELRGVGPKKVVALHEVGVDSILDLVTTYPRRWVDRTEEARVIDLVPGREALVLVTVRSVSRRSTRNRRTMVTAQVGDGSGRLSVVFFNQPWRERQLQPGLTVALFGRADTYRGSLQMTNPVVDLIGDRTGRIVPIYPQSEKADLNTWEMAGWVESALERCRPRGIADPVPAALRRFGLVDRQRALRHPRPGVTEKEDARRRLAFDELLRVQLVLVLRKKALERDAKGIRHDVSGALVARFHDQLPFALTDDQRAVIAEIKHDLAGPHPMHRLLQGDVGSATASPEHAPVVVRVATRARSWRRPGPGRAARGDVVALSTATVPAREPFQDRLPAGRIAHEPRPARSGGTRWPGWPTAPSTLSSAPTRSSRRASASPVSARS
jgi:ATP-dependent DNA helicase RecG